MNGELVSNLMVNGRNFFKGNPKIALDNLPAYMVDKVKVYRKETDENVALGLQSINKRDKELVMDVNLKHIYSFGWSANIEGGAGNDRHYFGKGFGLRFSNYSRSVVFANTNNLNDTKIPGTSGNWTSGANVKGIADLTTAGFMHTIDDRQKRFTYEGSVIFDYRNKHDNIQTSEERFMDDGNIWTRQNMEQEQKVSHIKTVHQFEYKKPNSRIFFRILPSFEYTDSKLKSLSFFANMDSNPVEEYSGSILDSIFQIKPVTFAQKHKLTTHQYIGNEDKGYYLNGVLDMNAKIKMPIGYETLIIKSHADYEKRHDYSKHINDIKYYKREDLWTRETKNNHIQMPLRKQNYGIEAQYHFQFIDKGKWNIIIEPSYTYSYSYDRSPKYVTSLKDSLMQVSEMMDIRNSYYSRKTVSTHTSSVYIFSKFNLTNNRGISFAFNIRESLQGNTLRYNRNTIDTTLVKNYSLFQPLINAIYDRSENESYILSYQMNRILPGMTEYLPIYDTFNPLYVFEGSKDLKIGTRHSISLDYTRSNWASGNSTAAGLSVSFTDNQTSRAWNYNKITGITHIKPIMIDGTYDVLAHLNNSGSFSKQRRLSYANKFITSVSKNIEYVNEYNRIMQYSLSEDLKLNYKSKRFNVSVLGNISYKYIDFSNEYMQSINVTDFRYGIQGSLSLPWNYELSSDLMMQSRRGYSDKVMNTNKLICNVQLAKSLIKNKLNARLVVYDLFGNINDVTHSINAYGRIETRHNTITRYAMLYIAYQFTQQPKKKNKQ